VLRGLRLVGVTAASWCGPVPGVTVGQPPAVTGIGLRRSGRTGNGDSPLRADRARLPAWADRLIPVSGAWPRGQCHSRRQAPGALRAPLMDSEETPHHARAPGHPGVWSDN